jgi:serine/threonine protein kinase/Tol biopolymer transport system component
VALTSGTRLGPYEILAPLGAGGMGEVYRVRDTRLNRLVAIKVAQERFSERFAREARAVAALNHPNICQLYDVGPDYLVMELVEGAPIATPDSPRRLLDFAMQIADGLAAAHAASIVHRDLKPDNILVTPDGRVKILDFGLAKAIDTVVGAGPDDSTRTIGISDRLTDPGTTVGTAAYMSPEQARGRPDLTPQSDQFSLGVVLYELAAGKQPFRRASRAETMAAIIREEPDPLPTAVHPPLRWVIERLLAKDPAERYDSTRDVYRELRQVRERYSQASSGVQPVAAAEPPTRRHTLAAWGLATIAIAFSLLLLALVLEAPSQLDLSSYRFTAITREGASDTAPEWSPDGKSIAYDARVHGVFQVFIKAIGADGAAQLTHSSKDCRARSWSKDGSTIYYSSDDSLWAVSASGGTPDLVLANANAPAMHPDGKTVMFERGGKLWIASLQDGQAREFWQLPHNRVVEGKFSPDGSKIALIESGDLWIIRYPAGTARRIGAVPRILQGGSWLPDNRHLLIATYTPSFVSTLWLLDVTDGSRRAVYTSPVAIEWPSVSPDGKRVAYATGALEWDVLEISLPEGSVRTVLGGGGTSWWPDWAPSGNHFVVATNRSGTPAIEDVSSTDGFSRRLASPPTDVGYVGNPRWAPDGSRFAFYSASGGAGRALMISNASGGGEVTIDREVQATHAWSPDGQWIAYVNKAGKLAKIKPVSGASAVILAKAEPALEVRRVLQWSPAGDWILYPVADGLSLISPDGNTGRKLTSRKFLAYGFSRDGTEVFGVFHNTAGAGAQWQLYSLKVKTGAEKLLAPVDLPASANDMAGFSLHPEGKRFLTSIAKWPYDIWMLEGFDQHKTWLNRLLRR